MEECQLIRLMEINHHSGGWVFDVEQDVSLVLKYLVKKIDWLQGGKWWIYWWDPERHQRDQVIKMSITIHGMSHICAFWCDVLKRAQHLFCHIPAKNAQPESGYEGTLDGPRVRGVLQNERSSLKFLSLGETEIDRRTHWFKLKET